MEVANVVTTPVLNPSWFVAVKFIAACLKNVFSMSKKRPAPKESPDESRDEVEGEGSATKVARKSHWSLGLVEAMNNSTFVVMNETNVTVIRDRYPKSEFHYLVIPHQNISNLRAVTKNDLGLLLEMHAVGEKVAQLAKHRNKTFLMGYHAVASMSPLHLHVLSDDFNSTSMKTAKHWNSYNTRFFLHSRGRLGWTCNNCELSDYIYFRRMRSPGE